jgi:hypothetical protein
MTVARSGGRRTARAVEPTRRMTFQQGEPLVPIRSSESYLILGPSIRLKRHYPTLRPSDWLLC